MTISSLVRTVGPIVGNGTFSAFPFSFKVFNTTELALIATDSGVDRAPLVLGTDYSVVLNPDQNAAPGGTITYRVASIVTNIPTGTVINGTSAVQNLQPTNLTNNGGFFPAVINAALDRLTILVQQIARVVGVSLQFPVSDGVLSGVLPNKATRLGKVQAYDAVTGLPIMSNLTLAQIESGSTSASASAALAALWASFTGGLVAALDYSAKAYAIGGTGITGVIGAAKEWAISASKPDGVNESSKTYAAQSSVSAAAALVSQNAAAASATVVNFRYCGTATGTANALVATPSAALTSLTAAHIIVVIASANTTEAMNIAVSGLTAKSIKVQNDRGSKVDPAIGQYQPGMMAEFMYDGTDFVAVNPVEDKKAPDIASATTVALAAVTGNFANLTGTTTVTGMTGLPAGRRFKFRHTGIHQLTNSGTFVTGSNIVTEVGDESEWVSDGTNVYLTSYFRLSGRLYLPDGASGAGNLAMLFAADTDTGIYRAGADDLRVQTAGADRIAINNGVVAINSSTANTNYNAKLHVRAGTDANLLIGLDSTAVLLRTVNNATSSLTPMTIDGTPLSFMTNATERARFTNTDVYFPVVGTTASAANAFLNSGSSPVNQLLRSTSSERYKKDIEPLELSYAENLISELTPIYYRSRAEADNPAHSHWGFTAEAVAKIDPRLVHWGYAEDAYEDVEIPAHEIVNYVPAVMEPYVVKKTLKIAYREIAPAREEITIMPARIERRLKEGAKLVPDGVQYERFITHAWVLIQDLRKRVNELEKERHS